MEREREKKIDRGDFMQTLDFREIVQLINIPDERLKINKNLRKYTTFINLL